MKIIKLLMMFMVFLQLPMMLHCCHQAVIPTQKWQHIIDDAIKP